MGWCQSAMCVAYQRVMTQSESQCVIKMQAASQHATIAENGRTSSIGYATCITWAKTPSSCKITPIIPNLRIAPIKLAQPSI